LLQEFHEKAKRTLKVLTRNMIAGDVSIHKIFDMYQEVERKNIIILILRCKMMYEARYDVRRLLVYLI